MIPLTDVDPVAAGRALVRDGRACTCCGAPVTGRPSGVLRRNRHAGDALSNLLTFAGAGEDPLDPADHLARVGSAIEPGVAEAQGWTVPDGADPALVAVMVFTSPGCGFTAWLGDDGERSCAEPGLAAAS